MKGFAITVVKLDGSGGGGPFAVTVLSFGNAVVLSQELRSDDEVTFETISLGYGTFGTTYNSQNPSGGLSNSYSNCFNLKTNSIGSGCYTGN